VVESTWTRIEASPTQQQALRELGVRLARNRTSVSEDGTDERAKRSVLHVRSSSGAGCEVRVVEAVGVIAVPSLTLDVSPKIVQKHLFYLLERASLLPRLGSAKTTLGSGQTLLELVAHWYVRTLERVLEEGLARDYRSERGEFPGARGRVLAMPTARLYFKGRLGVASEYQEFDFDTPLNRLLLHAARLLVRHPGLPEGLRSRTRRASLRMDGVGPLREDDRQARPDRRTIYYRDAALLAKHLIDGIGRTLTDGDEPAWTFLIRTPEAVELGLRRALSDVLPQELAPSKRALTLDGTDMELKPDLLFGRQAVADVKYKLSSPRWRRRDLYQLVAFATGFDVRHAAMIDFQADAKPRLKTIRLGRVHVAHLTWPALVESDPAIALRQLGEQVTNWAGEWSAS